jgi:hypothetical protein
MTTTTIRAALARLQALPWADYATRTAAGFRACWLAAQLLAAGIALLAAIAYEHRARIRAALVTIAAVLYVAAELTHKAGRHARRLWDALPIWSEALGRRYAALLVPATAPEPVRTASLEALSNRQLRELLGVRRRLSKRELLQLAYAKA